jgi:cytochrome c oxidase assembly factor CtaG
MAKHILFVLVIPALLLMGVPATAFKHLLRYPAAAHAARLLGRPAVAWTAGVGAMALWHIPVLFNAALAHESLHILEHLTLLIGGTVYWWPISSPIPEWRLPPVPHAAGYLFSSCVACTTIGVLITFAPRMLYPAYTRRIRTEFCP